MRLVERLADMGRFRADEQRTAEEVEAQMDRARLDLAAGEQRRVQLERQLDELRLALEQQGQAAQDDRDRLEAAIARLRQEGADVPLFDYVLKGGGSDMRLFRRLTSGGKAAMARGDHGRGEALLRLAALLLPMDGPAWRRFAGSLETLGEYPAAAVAWRRAIGVDQHDAVALYGLGRAMAEVGRHDDARAAMETAFAIDPGLPGLGERLKAVGVEPAKLVDLVLSSLWLRGRARKGLVSGIRHRLALRRARHAAGDGRPRSATRIYDRMVTLSDDPDELFRYGDAIARLMGPVAACRTYLKAVAARPDDGRLRRRALDVKHDALGFVVRPTVDLRTADDGSFVTMSDDAQMQLDPDGRSFPAGWTLISISASAPAAPIRPVVYAFHGELGAQVTAFTFPLIEGEAEVRCLLPLPEGIDRLRLDPTGHAGVTFRLHRAGWLSEGALEGRLFVPPPEGLAFVGEEPTVGGATDPVSRSFVLRPQNDLAVLTDGSFVSTGEDPQFDVEGAKDVLGGWTWIDLRIDGVETPLDPILYAWTEGEVVTIRLPEIVEGIGVIQALVRLPERVSQLRFDPACRKGVRFGAVAFGAGPMPDGNRVFLPCPAGPAAQPGAIPTALRVAAVYSARPLEQLEAVGNDRFRTTGDAPRVAIESDTADFPAGVVRLTLRVDEADQAIDAALYASCEPDRSPWAYRFGSLAPGVSYEYHLVLPVGVRALRFASGDTRNVTLTLPRVGLLPLDTTDEASYAVARREDMPPDAGPDAIRAGLQPLQHLEELDGVFRSTGHDPQFHIATGGAFPCGWTVVTVEMDVADTLARPILYVWSSAGVTAIQLASLGQKGRVQQLVHLPDDVSTMRLDPTDVAGTSFSAPQLSFSPASLFAGRLLARLPNAGRRVDYDTWCDLYDRIGPVDRALIGEAIDRFADRPLISILMPVYDPEPRFLKRALDTVIDQIYPVWELCIAEDCSRNEEIRTILRDYAARDERIRIVFRKENGHISRASNSALELVSGTFVALMDHDDELPPHALYLIADEINRFPDTDLIYSDEDKIDQNGRRHDPYFKNDWNQELFYSQNCVAHLGVFRTALVRAVGGFRAGFDGSQDYDLVLRILRLSSADRIRHIPHVLYHWRIFEGVRTFSSNNPSNSVDTARQAMKDYFAEAEPDSEVQPIPYFPGWWRIRRPLPTKPPSVTIIIPTRDRAELVRNCLDGVLDRTDYPAVDVIIVDNGSVKAESLNYFTTMAQHPRVTVLHDDGPFNYSRLNNMAVAQAAGEYVCFLNNDIETISPDWLSEMVSQILRPGVGAVGTRLLYASDTLQHAGITLGVYGIAAHGHRHFPGDSIGYFGHPQLVREVSAVTAAALLMPKVFFRAIGGFDEADLAVSYNDVDLCLRVREAGRKVVYTPFAALYHLESASRGLDIKPEQLELQRIERGYMTARWEGAIADDPFYSPNLTLTNEDYDLAFPPRASRPWLTQGDVAERLARLGQAALPVPSEAALASLAADTVIVIAGAAPFDMLARLSAAFRDGRPSPAAIVLVDSTARIDGFVGAGRTAAFRRSCDHVPLIVVDDPGQDHDVARAANLGLARVDSDHRHVVVIAEDCALTDGWFASLLRAWLAAGDPDGLISPRMFVRENRPRDGVLTDGYLEMPARQVAATPSDIGEMGDGYANLPVTGRRAPGDVTADEELEATELPASGMILARLAVLRGVADDAAGEQVFDPLLLTRAALFEDLARRLESKGVRCRATMAALGVLPGPRPRDIVHLWQHQHDYRWLNRKVHGSADDGTVEFICPFHRGDVLVGMQVAHTAFLAGIPIRLHVAESLLDWVLAFDPPFPVRGVPVKVPSAEMTALHLLRSYEYVVRHPDTGPRLARSHFARGLDAMRSNLAGVMLASVGLAPETPLVELRPVTDAVQEDEAATLLAPHGDRVILFHRTGGWGLKSLPDMVLERFASTVKAQGFRLVQIGGPGEAACEEADGMIAGNFAPGLWAALFRLADAVAGIDSWTAHMAAILDVPQITFYGSTHPDQVASKPHFRARRSPALLIEPTVACSPCNSLVCLIQPEPFCPGYSADRTRVSLFLRALDPMPAEERHEASERSPESDRFRA